MGNIIIPQDIKILLDAGHYGKSNQSPAVPEYYESDFTWKYHLLLKAELEEYGFKVDTTRPNKDEDLVVYERGLLAKGYDLFVSLHSDAYDKPVDHVSVFGAYDNLNGADVLGKILARVVYECMGVSNGCYKTYKSEIGDWEHYGVLRGARAAGCPLYYIIEHGFHTNPNVAHWLMNEDNLKILAEIEAVAIANYYGIEKTFIPGDVNYDGAIDVFDYVLAKRICFSTYKPTEEEVKRCDIDGDGKVSATDYLMIKRKAFGTLSDNIELAKKTVSISLERLSKGSKSEQVKNLQILLIGKGYSCGIAGADGVFGADTEKAVKEYQADMGIFVNGVVDIDTWTKILVT